MEIYKKENNEFIPIGMEFTGFPSNGLWLVEDGKQNCLIPMGDKPTRPEPALLSYMTFVDELSEKIAIEWDLKPLSVDDISKIACEFFALKAGGMKIGDEILEH